MSVEKQDKVYTRKQMGDACEMLIAAELTLAGVPALKVPDNWPGYDVLAQPPQKKIERISVKSRTYKKGPAYLSYDANDVFDWLAIVILGNKESERNIYIVPRNVADKEARKNKKGTKTETSRYWQLSEIDSKFGKYLNNFSLKKI